MSRAGGWAGQELVEESWQQQSVLSAQVLVDDGEEFVIPTGWSFISAENHDIFNVNYKAYCMTAGGLPHCKHHAVINPPMIPDPPPSPLPE